MNGEDLPDKVGHLLASPFVPDEDGGAGAGETAAEKSRSAQAQNLLQARDQFGPVWLVHPVFQGSGKRTGGSGSQGRHQQRRPLHIEHGVLLGVGLRQDRARLGGRQHEVGDDHGDAIAFRHRQANGACCAVGVDGAGDNGTENTGRDVVRMALDPRRLIQNTKGLPPQSQEEIRNHYAGGEGRRGRSESLTQRNLIVDMQVDRREVIALEVAGDPQGSLPDQIVGGFRDGRRIASGDTNGEFRRLAEGTLQRDV